MFLIKLWLFNMFYNLYRGLCNMTVSALTSSPDTCPNNASYYGNRAATLMMLGKFREALGDAQQSVRLDDSFVRVRGKLPRSLMSRNPCAHLCSNLICPFRVTFGKGSATFPWGTPWLPAGAFNEF